MSTKVTKRYKNVSSVRVLGGKIMKKEKVFIGITRQNRKTFFLVQMPNCNFLFQQFVFKNVIHKIKVLRPLNFLKLSEAFITKQKLECSLIIIKITSVFLFITLL